MWLNQLKVAIVTQDYGLLETLLNDIPDLNKDEMKSALYLFEKVKELLEVKKNEAQTSMKQIKKNIEFLKSGVADKPAKFDITS
jgi:hypothetical protein